MYTYNVCKSNWVTLPLDTLDDSDILITLLTNGAIIRAVLVCLGVARL